ncbi:primase-like DNA-binding domain-containing protein [Halobacteria archaeon AArc-m2/3/4]|uniref:Primase-like DNA-binding domain-containing protein n=1 Tax=Natronoglomus mannanivorans TaxID=2979990 RepID=A0ABT2QJA6_9EURY|nr:primase-like DNA-binding domain-containing protein [Halobacteria archaeon AArc-m2/3/4]
MSDYIRVTPTSEDLRIGDIPAALESLHKLTNSDAEGIVNRLNPFTDTSPPTFEFLAISTGNDEPVEFYYGVDQSAHLETLEKRLKTIYPSTFDVTQSELELTQKLVPPVEYSREEFRERLDQGNLLYEPSDDEAQQSLNQDDLEVTDGGRAISEEDQSETGTSASDPNVALGDGAEFEHASVKSVQNRSLPSSIDQPTLLDDGTVLARPPLDELEPIGIQWHGRAERKRDWMTTLKSFANRDPDPTEYDTEQPPLATVIDHLTEIEYPIAFQVVWQRKSNWIADAELREEDLRSGRDTFGQRYIGPLFEIGEIDPEDTERSLGSEAQGRIDRIGAKHPRRTFTTNIRAVALPTDIETTDESSDRRLDQLAQALNSLDGPFYELEGKRLRSAGVLERTKRKRARAALRNVLDTEFVTGRGKCRPDLVMNGDELANVTIVPSSEDLTVEGSRGTRSEQRSRNPLPRPHPDLMEEFRDGMAIGYALDETSEPEDEPVRIPPSLLPTHYVRAATTGGGKSKSLTNDKLSLYDETDGPIVLIDAKGDGLCQDYMRAHARRFGMSDLEENVLHFPIPDVLPGFAFFNLEPALENGVRRVDAVQNKADHYGEILKMVMGEDRYERAVVAPNLIKYLIKTLYDEEYGRENGRYRESVNYFAHDQLEHVVDQLWRAGPPEPEEGAAPRSSNPQVRRRIDRQLQLDPNSFATVMGGVSNRLDYISQDEHLRRIFNNTDPQFDFREILDERKVILFDLSGLRDDSAKAMTGVILTQLYDALKERGDSLQAKPDDYVVNLIIDEASSLAVSDVMTTLLEKGRSYRLSVGLSLQFPEQLDVKGGREVYLNVLNDVGSPIIGKIAVDDEIAKVMAHEDMDPVEFANRIRSLPRGEWIVRLPSPTFGETGPEPFSLAPLPIPPGHPESDDPLTAREEQEFQAALDRIHDRASTEYGAVSSVPPSSQTSEAVRETFDLPSADIDVALARAVRTVQLQRGVRDENGWVPVQAVDETLRTQYEAANESPPSIEELGDIRERSRLLEVTLEQEDSEIVVRLTADGETATEPETGDVRSAGSETHDELLYTVEQTFSQHGFDVTIFTQDGSEKPDGRAIHPDSAHVFDLEAESATVEKPVKVLRNFQRAHNAGHTPLFVVATSDQAGSDKLQAAARLESILSSPVNELESGERRLYTTDSHIMFNGGANAREGVTAVRPAGDDSRRSVWTSNDGMYVLTNGAGTEFVTVSSFDDLSRSDVPGVYSYDRAADEYVVYEHNKRHVYERKSEFEQDWVPIRRPFVPETDLSQSAGEYEIVVIDSSEESACVYRDEELHPLEVLVQETDAMDTDSAESSIYSDRTLLSIDEPESETETTNAGESSKLNSDDKQDSGSENIDFGSFVEECVVEQEDAEIPKEDLYAVYQEWAATYDQKEYSKSWFGRKLSDYVTFDEYRPTRNGERVRYYTGITLSHEGRKFLD